jgi:hypothetical protein
VNCVEMEILYTRCLSVGLCTSRMQFTAMESTVSPETFRAGVLVWSRTPSARHATSVFIILDKISSSCLRTAAGIQKSDKLQHTSHVSLGFLVGAERRSREHHQFDAPFGENIQSAPVEEVGKEYKVGTVYQRLSAEEVITGYVVLSRYALQTFQRPGSIPEAAIRSLSHRTWVRQTFY